MWKKLLILLGVLGVAAVVVRKVRTANEERALWHEATTAPDLEYTPASNLPWFQTCELCKQFG